MVEEKLEIEVKLFASFREIVGKKTVFLPANTVKELLGKIKKEYEDLGKEIFSNPDTKELNGFVNIIVNGQRIETLEDTETKLKEGDRVAIFPPVAGG